MQKRLTPQGQKTIPKKTPSLSTARSICGILKSKEHHSDEEIRLAKRPIKKFEK
jgi:hypothetical protein